jgi:NAD-dependent DNA ligase
MHGDHANYWDFRRHDRVYQALHTLMGIIQGVSIDDALNRKEVDFLRQWIREHEEVRELHPYNQLMGVVEPAIADGVITEDERDAIRYLCEHLISDSHMDNSIVDMQRLHAILAGIGADRLVREQELRGLSDWLERHKDLRRTWPYEETCSLVTGILSDGRIDEREHALLLDFCAEFVAMADRRTIVNPPLRVDGKLVGLCAVCPSIEFKDRTFCLTGASSRGTRADIAARLIALGARVINSVSSRTDFLVIGDDGNPCWTYTCYGRKIERAAELRRQGAKLMIIHESDLFDALADAS